MRAPVAAQPPARARVGLVVDRGSFEAWDPAGESESIVTGLATVDGRPIAVIAGEFAFMAGTIGVAAAERVLQALERARCDRLPVLALTASGGIRMQEGSAAFVQMVALAAAVRRLRDAAVPYIVYLGHPTLGGVLASFGSLATVTFAQPGALIGFTGPRVVRGLTGAVLPDGAQSAEHLHRHGLVDELVGLHGLRDRVRAVLEVTSSPARRPGRPARTALRRGAESSDPWAAVQLARHPGRPRGAGLLAAWTQETVQLRGDRAGGGDDSACVTALARLEGRGVVVIAQRGRPARMAPAGYRKARRAMTMAEELALPLVTIVDTPGAVGEECGLAGEIAHCLATMAELTVPTVGVLAGEGAGGGALALLAADRIVCARNAYLAPLAPEGAATILFRTPERAPDAAVAQRIVATELEALGLVDVVVGECPSADREPDAFAARLGAAVAEQLDAVAAKPAAERIAARELRRRSATIAIEGNAE